MCRNVLGPHEVRVLLFCFSTALFIYVHVFILDYREYCNIFVQNISKLQKLSIFKNEKNLPFEIFSFPLE